MKRIALWLIDLYRGGISPGKPPCCRYTPTCSLYAREAIERWGLVVGGYLAFFRVLRCNPMWKGGFDPVPQKNENKS